MRHHVHFDPSVQCLDAKSTCCLQLHTWNKIKFPEMNSRNKQWKAIKKYEHYSKAEKQWEGGFFLVCLICSEFWTPCVYLGVSTFNGTVFLLNFNNFGRSRGTLGRKRYRWFFQSLFPFWHRVRTGPFNFWFLQVCLSKC